MKKLLLAIGLLLFCDSQVFSQNQVNYWMSDYYGQIQFKNGKALPEYRDGGYFFFVTLASISDSMGDLLFYTNGFIVFNDSFQIMQNGDSLNIGDYITYGYNALSIPDGAVIIPNPAKNNQYYLFHFDFI